MFTWRNTVLAVAALALAGASSCDYYRWRSTQGRLEGLIADLDAETARAEISAEVRRDVDPQLARLRIARAVVAWEVDPSRLASLAPGERRETAHRSLTRLRLTEATAAEVLRHRPASWEAALLLGASRYLVKARGGTIANADWQTAIEAARALGPGQAEPKRVLAAIYLNEWSRLSETHRREALDLLRSAFTNLATFEMLYEAWMRVAPTLEQALSVLPDNLAAWQRLRDSFAYSEDWQRYRDAHKRWSELLLPALEADLAQADEWVKAGDVQRSSRRYLELLRRAIPQHRYVPPLRHVLDNMPTVALAPYQRLAFERWLDWTLELCLYRRCPLEPQYVRRLTSLSGVSDLPRLALADLVAGDLARAEMSERRASSLTTPEWGPYLIVKAGWLRVRGRAEAAAEVLTRVHGDWRRAAVYLREREAVARAVGDRDGAARALEELQTLRRDSWPASAWRPQGRSYRLELLPSRTSGGLEIDFQFLPPGGAAVATLLNGAEIDCFAVAPGDRLRVHEPVAGEVQLLEIQHLAGGRIQPGAVRLR